MWVSRVPVEKGLSLIREAWPTVCPHTHTAGRGWTNPCSDESLAVPYCRFQSALTAFQRSACLLSPRHGLHFSRPGHLRTSDPSYSHWAANLSPPDALSFLFWVVQSTGSQPFFLASSFSRHPFSSSTCTQMPWGRGSIGSCW